MWRRGRGLDSPKVYHDRQSCAGSFAPLFPSSCGLPGSFGLSALCLSPRPMIALASGAVVAIAAAVRGPVPHSNGGERRVHLSIAAESKRRGGNAQKASRLSPPLSPSHTRTGPQRRWRRRRHWPKQSLAEGTNKERKVRKRERERETEREEMR